MARKVTTIIVSSLLMFGAFDGCTFTKRITLRSELAAPLNTGPISILTKDRVFYKLSNYRLTDSSIVGSGFLLTNGEDSSFAGELKLTDIGYIRAEGSNFFKGVLTLGVTGYFIGLSSIGLGGSGGLQTHERIVTPVGGGGSCPFVYSWNGSDFALEGESFGVGLGRALEVTTCTVLHSVVEHDGIVTLRLSNERPETHYFNSVKMVAVQTDAHGSVLADESGALWAVDEELPLICGINQSGKDVTSELRKCDGNYWESDLSQTVPGSTFQDEIEILLANPRNTEDGSLVVHAINTHISEVIYSRLSSFLGDGMLSFVDALEHDPSMIGIMRSWLEDASLKAYLWTGASWKRIGTILPEADVVNFSKVIRFNTEGIHADTLRIRLTSLADVWKIDAVGVDWSRNAQLRQNDLQILSARGPRNRDARQILSSADNSYEVLLPSENIDLDFKAYGKTPTRKVTYAVYVRGFLYEWSTHQEAQKGAMWTSNIPEEFKVSALKILLQDKQVFLPHIYAEWKQMRGKL